MIRSRIAMAALAAAAGMLFPLKASTRLNTSATAQIGCTSAPVVCENQLPGNPPSEWDVSGSGDRTLQGFATDISVNQGETVHFNIKANNPYRLDIYRMGYYNGAGARKVAAVRPLANVPQYQPACLSEKATGLYDCGNWSESANWPVPEDATSGIYFARLVRLDGGGASHIFFIVRADSSRSDLLFQTSDTTWEAYNDYGGSSLYPINSSIPRSVKVSYNRPFMTRNIKSGQSWVFNAEYPMVRWLEANGYDVSYFTGVDTDRRGELITNHGAFLSVGHDEYWSTRQRANVEVARAAGVNLAFFSGNEMYWKTRWEPSIDGSATPYRTLVCYKETIEPRRTDPAGPAVWTGTWRDPRFSPPGDGGRPENAVSGTLYYVDAGRKDAITVGAEFGRLRFWRNTSIAELPAGSATTFPPGTLGYEWDIDLDNGNRPAALFHLSETSVNITGALLLNFGTKFGSGRATHSLTLYRAGSGSLVFGAGTIQWSWGLDSAHDNSALPPSRDMQQATVNLLTEMGAQPATLQPGLQPALPSGDHVAPKSAIMSPAPNAVLDARRLVTVTGVAADSGEGVVAAVEVSLDNGATWHPVQGRARWTYDWTPNAGTAVIRSRAVDDSGNLEEPEAGVAVRIQ